MKRVFRVRRHAGSDSGQAMLEFILAFPPVLVLMLMIIEFAHFANVNQFAQYAAFAAARARLVADDSAAAQAAREIRARRAFSCRWRTT